MTAAADDDNIDKVQHHVISKKNNNEQAAFNALCDMANKIQSLPMTMEVYLH